MTKKESIIIADDHPLFLYGVKQVVSGIDSFEIVSEFNSGEKVLEFIRDKKPDLALLDIRMPGCSGLEILQRIYEQSLPTKVVLLTMYKNLNYFYKAVSFGVKGYILKESAVNELRGALLTIMQGGVFISELLHKQMESKRVRKADQDIILVSLDSLTTAEKNVLKLLAEWKSTREIAEELFISERTVSNHRNHISDKLNLKGANRIVRFAIENKDLF